VHRSSKPQKEHNLVAGIHTNGIENAALLSQWGYQMLTTVNDTVLLNSAAKAALKQARQNLDS
jgi:2-keto-3-deoxy-L-rhamnonate aldolase RhmA